MLSTNKLKKIKSNFPVLVGDNVVSKSICNLLIKEISNSKSFDDMIMGGRSRINKGSKNFNSYIKNSVNSAKLFKLFNSKTFYKKIESIFIKNFKDGDQVAALVNGGGYAEFCVADQETTFKIPTSLNMEEASSLPECYFTAWSNLIQRGELKKGSSVLVHGGTSGIGIASIQILQVKNFIVYKSSAGSGKTYNLALNYISLSLGNGHFKKDYFRKILAITFTNKAAKEMKERILHYLFNLSKENDVDNILNEIKLKTQLSEDLIFKFSKELYSYIIHNYSDLGIQTIDKFTYKLVKSFSRDLGVNSDFELELDSQKIIQPVVASLLNKISDDNKFFSDVLVDFALQKIDDGNSYNIQNDLEEFCKHFFIEDSQNKLNHNSFSIKESKEIKDNLFSKKKSCKAKIDDLQKEVISFFSKNNLTENHFLRGTYYNLFYKKLSSSNYKDWIPSSSLLNNIENDVWYKKNLEDNFKIKIDSLKENLVNYIKELLDLTKDYITYNSILNKIYPTIIINELLKQIETFKKENNIEHISAFNRKIHHLVTTQVSSFIFERLGERYNHFLIDEFQDTSILQWQNFLPLITDALDFGKSIVVGDGKQSIYRWRSGEVEQFLNLPLIFKGNNLSYFSEWQAKLNNHYFEKNLSENFRSKKNIIQFNNEFFSSSKEILSQDYIKIYDNSQQTFSFSKEGGYVKIDLFDQLVFEENMLQQIIFEINDFVEKRNYNFNDIAILCNTHKEIEMIANFLSSKNIPIVSNEGLLISKSPKIGNSPS